MINYVQMTHYELPELIVFKDISMYDLYPTGAAPETLDNGVFDSAFNAVTGLRRYLHEVEQTGYYDLRRAQAAEQEEQGPKAIDIVADALRSQLPPEAGHYRLQEGGVVANWDFVTQLPAEGPKINTGLTLMLFNTSDELCRLVKHQKENASSIGNLVLEASEALLSTGAQAEWADQTFEIYGSEKLVHLPPDGDYNTSKVSCFSALLGRPETSVVGQQA